MTVPTLPNGGTVLFRDVPPPPMSDRGSNLAGPAWGDVERWAIGPTVDDGRTIQGVRVA